MKDDYLWDGSGEPDPEIQKLETALGRFGHRGEELDFSRVPVAEPTSVWRRWMRPRWTQALAAAAGVLVVAAGLVLLRWGYTQRAESTSGWEIANVVGTTRVESNANGSGASAKKLGVGETLVTDAHSKATITVAELGAVDIEPNSRLRLLAKKQGHNRLELERGTIHAFIWAPAGEFAVDTPSAIAVDLGCQYTLQVDDSGAGTLRTTLGWVGFKLENREAFIPAGAVCATRPKIGPGTPYFEDAPAAFCEALSKFDFGSVTAEQKKTELEKILNDARKRDALTVWHLLSRVDEAERGRVYDKLATLVPPPTGVTREGILKLDQKMLDRWWNALDLGDVGLWRTFERSWTHNKS